MNLINEILRKTEKIDFKFPNSFDQLMNDEYYDYDKFEWFLYYYFKKIGNEVKKIGAKGKGDGGADLIVSIHQKDGSIYRVGIQAKYWKNRVGAGPINQLASAKSRHDLSHLWLITTSDLTSDAKEIAEVMQISILRAEDVKKMIEDIKEIYQKEITEKGISSIEFLPIKEKKVEKVSNAIEKPETQIESDLKELRIALSKKYKLFPLYMVYNNEEMNSLIETNPQKLEDLNKVKGFGAKKIETFGKEIIEFFNNLKTSNNSNTNDDLYKALLEERPKIARYNKLTEDEVYSDKVAGYLAKMKPKTKEDLNKIFGFRKENIEIFGEYLVKVINKVK